METIDVVVGIGDHTIGALGRSRTRSSGMDLVVFATIGVTTYATGECIARIPLHGEVGARGAIDNSGVIGR